MKKPLIRSTTVLGVIHNGASVIGADGQATMGNTVVKSNVKKVRKIGENKVLIGFAGATADAFTLLEHFEAKMSKFGDIMRRAAIELAKEWRTDRMLRKLEAMIVVVMNKEEGYIVSGTGDVLEPDNQILAIGSGSMYAQAAAIALKKHAPQLSAEEIVRESLQIASDICIYTNSNFEIIKL